MRVIGQSLVACGLVAALARPGSAQPEPSPPTPPEPAPPLPPGSSPPIEPAPVNGDNGTLTELPPPLPPPTPTVLVEDDGTQLDIYGFAMLDAGYDFGKIGDPLWQDTLRPTKLPSFRNEFGKGGRTFMGVRQTRFGVKGITPTERGDVKATFEFELFGTGADEGQTTFRLRHAYGDWGQLRAGQTWSPFMDIDVFPNSIEYWGPNGMAFFRNVQVAWMPIQGDSRITIAAERPGASPDTGIYVDRIELEDVVARFPAPDISAEARLGGKWGYVELAGILRWIKWDDLNPDVVRLDGDVLGWGVNLSSNLRLGPVTLRLQGVYGEGIQNYMNDAGADVGVRRNTDPGSFETEPIEGVALPILGLVGFADIKWCKTLTSTAGWSFVWVDNSDGQTPSAFHIGHYALANLLFHPSEKLMFGPEIQFGRRENNSDGWAVNDYRAQFSARYHFSKTIGKRPKPQQ